MSPSTCRIRTTKKRTREDNLDVDAVECPVQKRVRSTGSCTVVDWIECIVPSSSAVEEFLGKEHLGSSERKQLSFTPPTSPLNEALTPPETRLTRDALRKFSQIMDMPSPHLQPESTVNTKETDGESIKTAASVGPYDNTYERRLRIRGIQIANYNEVPPPSNFAELKAALLVPWTGPEPDDDAAMDFRRTIETVNEAKLLLAVLPPLLANYNDLMVGNIERMAVDAQWDRKLLLKPMIRPILTPAKPDATIGWDILNFPQNEALDELGLYAQPAASDSKLTFPIFNIEAKGENGTLQIACLQSLHASAIVLQNLLQLRTLAGKRSEFFNRAHVMSAEMTTETLQLTCYWATEAEGEVKYYGKCVKAWCLRDPEGKGVKKAQKGLNNAIRWTLKQARPWIDADLDALKKQLVADQQKRLAEEREQLALNPRTPASKSRGGSSRGKGRGRSSSRGGGRGDDVRGQKRNAPTSSLSQPESSRRRTS